MRNAAELFTELRKGYAEAVQEEGDDLFFFQLAVVFPETTISVSPDWEGFKVLSDAMNVGGVPVGYLSAVRRTPILAFKWSPLDEFREDEECLERANCFLSAIAEAAAWELKRLREVS
jgi:hypothetical protein